VGFFTLKNQQDVQNAARQSDPAPVVDKQPVENPPAATPDGGVEQAVAAPADAAVEAVATPDASVEVATKPIKQKPRPRPRPRPGAGSGQHATPPPGGGGGDDLDNPFPH
jgi:hypothetical protein